MSHRPKIGPGKPLPARRLDLNALTPKPLHAEQGDPKQILQYCAGGVSVLTAVLNEAGAKLHHGQRAFTEKHWAVARACAERVADACGRAERIVAGRILAVGEDLSPAADAAPVGDVRAGLEAVGATLQAAIGKTEGRAISHVYDALARLLVVFIEAYDAAERYVADLGVLDPGAVAKSRELFETCGALAELSLSAIKAATLTERAAADQRLADACTEQKT